MQIDVLRSILDFIARLVESLAWPVVALLGAMLFRAPLLQVMRTLRSVKYKDAEVSFDAAVDELTTDAKNAGFTVLYPMSTVPTVKDPRSFVLDEWLEIERLLKDSAMSLGVAQQPSPSLNTILSALTKSGHIDAQLANVIRSLQATRNSAVHDAFFSLNEIEKRELAGTIKSVKDRLNLALTAI